MLFTSESVTEGHPDKVADFISDSVLDACLEQDPASRVACETLVKSEHVVLAGEITTRAALDLDRIVRDAIRAIGYTDPAEAFSADRVRIQNLLTKQVSEIASGVQRASDDPSTQGAGDQGIMFGYATDETDSLLPLPIDLAHRLSRRLAEDRKSGRIGWLRPDGKTQVTVEYNGHTPMRVTDVLVSAQHAADTTQREIASYVRDDLVPAALGRWASRDIRILVNPSGSFVEGGPSADAGLTGRKIIVDTYGGFARHGGGAFSGKDPSKVDRSGAYFCRWAARQLIKRRLCRRAEIQVSYAIGRAQPVSVMVETFGSGDPDAARMFIEQLSFRPRDVATQLGLLRPIYRQTTNYGHFGRSGLPWED